MSLTEVESSVYAYRTLDGQTNKKKKEQSLFSNDIETAAFEVADDSLTAAKQLLQRYLRSCTILNKPTQEDV
jgi:hypothetical protein